MAAGGEAVTHRLGPREMGPLFRRLFPGERLIVVSNREPYEHRWTDDDDIEVGRPAGGLTSALDPLMQAVGGVWIAWGSGNADAAVVNGQDRVRVPPEDPRYTLRRIWLDRFDVQDYYRGYSNQILWPLCHLRPALTRVRARFWERYRSVNRRFAEAVLAEARDQAGAVWFQDYHLALAPGFVRAMRPDLRLAHFWHIPWPPPELFRVAPQAPDLLRGLLSNDLLGFHVPVYTANFLECAQEVLGAEVDWRAGTVRFEGRTCLVRAFPISIDVEAFVAAATAPHAEDEIARIRAHYAARGAQLGIGVDRLDYSKGLPEKLKALDFLWERYPEFRERFTFLQVAVPSRSDIDAYDELSNKVERMVWEVNDRYGTLRWRPVHLIKEAVPPERLALLYRAADLCIVSSLQDGMNLVAKEYVACQVDHTGVLLLSTFAGAAEELSGAFPINPYDPEDMAVRIRSALVLPMRERRERMRQMRRSMRTIYDWMAEIFHVWSGTARGGTGAVRYAPRPAVWSRARSRVRAELREDGA